MDATKVFGDAGGQREEIGRGQGVADPMGPRAVHRGRVDETYDRGAGPVPYPSRCRQVLSQIVYGEDGDQLDTLAVNGVLTYVSQEPRCGRRPERAELPSGLAGLKHQGRVVIANGNHRDVEPLGNVGPQLRCDDLPARNPPAWDFALSSALAVDVLGPPSEAIDRLISWRLILRYGDKPTDAPVRVRILPEVHAGPHQESHAAFWAPGAKLLTVWAEGAGGAVQPTFWMHPKALLGAIDTVYVSSQKARPMDVQSWTSLRGKPAAFHLNGSCQLTLAIWPPAGAGGQVVVFDERGQRRAQMSLHHLLRENLLGLALNHGGDVLAWAEGLDDPRTLKVHLCSLRREVKEMKVDRTVILTNPEQTGCRDTAGLEFNLAGTLLLCHLPGRRRGEGVSWLVTPLWPEQG